MLALDPSVAAQVETHFRLFVSQLAMTSSDAIWRKMDPAQMETVVEKRTGCTRTVAEEVARLVLATNVFNLIDGTLRLNQASLSAFMTRFGKKLLQSTSDAETNVYWNLLTAHMLQYSPSDTSAVSVSYAFCKQSQSLNATIAINGMQFVSSLPPNGAESIPSAQETRNDAARLALLFLRRYHASIDEITKMDTPNNGSSTHQKDALRSKKELDSLTSTSGGYQQALLMHCRKKNMPIPEYRVVELDAGLGHQAFVTIDKVSGEEVGGTRQERKTAARESAAKMRCDYQFDIIRAPRNNRHSCQVSVGNLGVWTSNNRAGYTTKQEAKESAAKNAVIGVRLKPPVSGTVERPNLNLGLRKNCDIRESTISAKPTASTVRPNLATSASSNAAKLTRHRLPSKPHALPPKPNVPQGPSRQSSSTLPSVAPTPQTAAVQSSHPSALAPNPQAPNDPASLLAILQQQQKLIAQQQAWFAQQADALLDANEPVTKKRRNEKE
ncbi:hypothetical protein HDU81_007352 [Chytriomyces hyalinus]|nr:hypothetical protein HDU81_007352 [Chytriomyces hyalinus]